MLDHKQNELNIQTKNHDVKKVSIHHELNLN